MEFLRDESRGTEQRDPAATLAETSDADFEFDDPTLVAFGVVALLWIGLLMACFVF